MARASCACAVASGPACVGLARGGALCGRWSIRPSGPAGGAVAVPVVATVPSGTVVVVSVIVRASWVGSRWAGVGYDTGPAVTLAPGCVPVLLRHARRTEPSQPTYSKCQYSGFDPPTR